MHLCSALFRVHVQTHIVFTKARYSIHEAKYIRLNVHSLHSLMTDVHGLGLQPWCSVHRDPCRSIRKGATAIEQSYRRTQCPDPCRHIRSRHRYCRLCMYILFSRLCRSPSIYAHQNPKFYRSERSVLNPNQSEAVRSSEYNEATEDLDAHSIYVPEYISFQDSQNLLST